MECDIVNILEEIKKEHDEFRNLLKELNDTDPRYTKERKAWGVKGRIWRRKRKTKEKDVINKITRG